MSQKFESVHYSHFSPKLWNLNLTNIERGLTIERYKNIDSKNVEPQSYLYATYDTAFYVGQIQIPKFWRKVRVMNAFEFLTLFEKIYFMLVKIRS